LEQATATALVEAGPLYLKSVVLTPAAAVATVTIEDSAAGGGTDLLSLQAAANGNSAVWTSGEKDGVYFATGVHATIAGAGALLTLEYEK
jgi:hypothetical protein